MIAGLVKRTGTWLPTVLVLVVVLLAGSRLVMLSLERHADDARVASRNVLAEHRASVEGQIRELADAGGTWRKPGERRGNRRAMRPPYRTTPAGSRTRAGAVCSSSMRAAT